MKKVYNQIKEIDNVDKCSVPEALCKFSEEAGEFVREVNKTFGRKVTTESKEEILNNVKEELADTIQNLFLIASRFDISVDDIEEEIQRKNGVWKEMLEKRK